MEIETDAEILLWSRIRCKQIKNIQFYRKKPLGNFIVDFYARSIKLVIEVDGGQHFFDANLKRDKKRDAYLKTLNLKELRFDNFQILKSLDGVLEVIFDEIVRAQKSPRRKKRADPLLQSG